MSHSGLRAITKARSMKLVINYSPLQLKWKLERKVLKVGNNEEQKNSMTGFDPE